MLAACQSKAPPPTPVPSAATGTPPAPTVESPFGAQKEALRQAGAFNTGASALYADYQANEVAADEKFKGKRGVLTGEIASITKDAVSNIVLEFLAGPDWRVKVQHERVFVTLRDSEKTAAMALRKGDAIAVLGTGATMIVGIPRLIDATVLTRKMMDEMTLEAVDAGLLPASALTTISSAKPPPKAGGRR